MSFDLRALSSSQLYSFYRLVSPRIEHLRTVVEPILKPALNPINRWTQDNTQAALITSVAFAALGIICFVVSVNMLIQASLGVILGLVSAGCLALSITTGHALVKQALAARRYMEDMEGQPSSETLETCHKHTLYESREILTKGIYTSPSGLHKIDLTQVVGKVELVKASSTQVIDTQTSLKNVCVKAADFLFEAAHLHHKKLQPLVLISGDDQKPCAEGDSLEPELYLRTAFGVPQKGFYPLEKDNVGIYAPAVPVFRSNFAQTGYKLMEWPFSTGLGILSNVTSEKTLLSFGKKRNPEEVIREKLYAFFNRACGHHQSIVIAISESKNDLFRHQNAPKVIFPILKEFASRFKEIVVTYEGKPPGELIDAILPVEGKAFNEKGEEIIWQSDNTAT